MKTTSEPMGPADRQFPEAVVKELRRENKRRRKRAADLEAALIKHKVEALCHKIRSDPSLPGRVSLDKITVDDDCNVLGVESAVEEAAKS